MVLSIRLVCLKAGLRVVGILALFVVLSCLPKGDGAHARSHAETTPSDTRESLANCLADRGWVMYSSFTCPPCRAQQKAFGKALVHLKVIECHPHAPDSKVELCIAKGIKITPTWIQETGGQEMDRLQGYRSLEVLAAHAGCDF